LERSTLKMTLGSVATRAGQTHEGRHQEAGAFD
jgi:hypothetical protein